MRKLTDATNVNAPDSDYPYGRSRNDAGAIIGTAVIETLLGDLLVNIQKLAAAAGVTVNSLPDNETNGYQLFESIIKAVLKNTYTFTPTDAKHVALKGYVDYYVDWYAKGLLKVSGPHTIASSDDITITLPTDSVIVNMKGTRGGGNWLFSFGYNSSVQDISVEATSSTQYNLYNATGGEITNLYVYYMVYSIQPA